MLPTQHVSQYFDFCNPYNEKRTFVAGIPQPDLPDLAEMGHGWQVRTPLPHTPRVRTT